MQMRKKCVSGKNWFQLVLMITEIIMFRAGVNYIASSLSTSSEELIVNTSSEFMDLLIEEEDDIFTLVK